MSKAENMPYPPDPLYDIEAERAVLGAMLEDNKTIPTVVEILPSPECFFKVSHQLIYRAIDAVYNRLGATDALLTAREFALMAAEDLEKNGEIGRIGGAIELYELQQSVPSSENVEYYADIVKNKAFRRRMDDAAKKLARLAKDEQVSDIGGLSGKAEEIFSSLSEENKRGVRTAHEVAVELFEEIDARTERRLEIGSGFPSIDAITGGYHPGDFHIIAGRPSMGKTSFAWQSACHIAFEKQIPLLFCSYEMKDRSIMRRELARRTSISYRHLETEVFDDIAKNHIQQKVAAMADAPLYIVSESIGIQRLRALVRYMKSRCDIKVVVVDYLQIIPADKSYYSPVEKVTEYSAALKGIARDYDVCMVALSQLSRAGEKRAGRRPVLSDLRESGALEQDADIVQFVHRPGFWDDEDTSGLTKIYTDKNRNGPTGDVSLFFRGETFDFVEG